MTGLTDFLGFDVSVAAVMGVINNVTFGSGVGVPYSSVFGDPHDAGQIANNPGTRSLTVAQMMSPGNGAAMGDEGGNAIYFDAAQLANYSDQDLAILAFHEAIHVLNSEGRRARAVNSGATEELIKANCF